MAIKLVDLYRDLRAERHDKGKPGFYMVWRVPRRDINIDESETAKLYARGAANHIRAQLKEGRAPDGAALPSLKPESKKRRRFRENQGDRGGHAVRHYRDPERKHDVYANFRHMYELKGKLMKPKEGGARGNHSGLLIKSIRIRKVGADRFMVLHDGRRSMDVVLYGRRVWTDAASRGAAMNEIRKTILGKIIGKQTRALFRELRRTMQNLKSLAADVEALGDE